MDGGVGPVLVGDHGLSDVALLDVRENFVQADGSDAFLGEEESVGVSCVVVWCVVVIIFVVVAVVGIWYCGSKWVVQWCARHWFVDGSDSGDVHSSERNDSNSGSSRNVGSNRRTASPGSSGALGRLSAGNIQYIKLP